MDYTLEGIDYPTECFDALDPVWELLFSGDFDLTDDMEAALSGESGAEWTGPQKEAPELIATLKDPEFDVPGGEDVRRYWLEGARVIRGTLKQLEDRGLWISMSRCCLGANVDGSVSLDVAVHAPRVAAEVREGDEVKQGALAVLKLEDGNFDVSVAPRIYRVVCGNGQSVFDREERPDWSEVPTLAAVRTFIEAGLMFCLLGFERFYREVEVLREADQEFVVDADEFLRAAEQEAGINLPPAARSKALHDFSRSKRGTRWDLLNATTARAHDALDAKGARDLELLGGVIAGLQEEAFVGRRRHAGRSTRPLAARRAAEN